MDERMAAFVNSLDRGNPPWLEELEQYARETQVPVILRQTQGLIRFLLAFLKPANILEVGTAIGFSALFMSEYAPFNCRIATIEKQEERAAAAQSFFEKAGRSGRITLLKGDAADILKKVEGSYDLIFMDAAKAQYLSFLPDVLKLLKEGGLLVSDNCLWDGDIMESRFAVKRRNRTIHARMREYLYELTHHPLLQTTVLTVGDGVALSVKKGTE